MSPVTARRREGTQRKDVLSVSEWPAGTAWRVWVSSVSVRLSLGKARTGSGEVGKLI